MLSHLGLLSEHAAKKFGDKEALVFDEQSFSFQELHDMVETFGAGLTSLGVKEKDVVTLYASNSWEWIVSYFAIAMIGAAALFRIKFKDHLSSLKLGVAGRLSIEQANTLYEENPPF